MPLYEYHCPKDGTFELVRKFSDPPLEVCPTCAGPIEKLVSAPAIQFKGTGWYITDYARKSTGGEAAGNKDSANKDSANKDSGKKDSGKKDSGKKDGGSTEKSSSDASKAAASTPSTTESKSTSPTSGSEKK